MIVLNLDTKNFTAVHKALKDVGEKAPRVLASATNDTAKDARKILAKKAQETYVIKTAKFNKSMNIKKATGRQPTAVIQVKGTANDLASFKSKPSKIGTPTDIVKAKVVKENKMKALQKNGLKAFFVRYKSGHASIAERISAKRLPIKNLYSLSTPGMIGSEKRVYGILKPEIQELLMKNVEKQIEKQLAKG